MRRVRPSAVPLVIIGLVVAAGVPRLARAQEELLRELRTIESVRIEGNRRIGDREIRSVMKTRSPSILPWREKPIVRMDFIRFDLEAIPALYRHHGYLDATASSETRPSRDSSRVIVIFRIQEGRQSRIRDVRIGGTVNYPERDLKKKLWAKAGRPFDPAYLQLDTLLISALYQERGFRPRTEATARRESLSIDVHYEVHEGPQYRVGQVYVVKPTAPGGYQVDEKLVRREIVVREGEVYKRSRMVQTQERLYETGLFSQVQITPLPDSSNTVVEYFIQVRDRRPRWLDLGIGGGTLERFRLTGEWGHRNLLGRGYQGATSSILAFDDQAKFKRWRGEGSLLAPWIFGQRVRFQLTPYVERIDDRTGGTRLIRQAFAGVDLQLRRELSRIARVSLTQRNVFAHQDIFLLGNTLSPTEVDSLLSSIVAQYSTHRIQTALERDTRDDLFLPLRGSAQSLVGEIAGGPLTGSSSFSKGQIQSTWYTPLPNGWTLANRVRAGVIDPFGGAANFTPGVVDSQVARVPYEDRFRSGGVNSIRGYSEGTVPGNAQGGLAVLEVNAELRIPTSLRIPFLGPLGLEVYADAGNVWSRPGYIKASQFKPRISRTPVTANDVRYTVGLGPRIDLPIGPLRLDVTWALRPGQVIGPNEIVGPRTYGRPVVQFAIGPSF